MTPYVVFSIKIVKELEKAKVRGIIIIPDQAHLLDSHCDD